MSDLSSTRPQPIDLRRYRKVRWFVLRVLLQALLWDLILNRRWLGWLRPDPVARYRHIARRYRALAVEMGGVLIKAGQFLSIRVDLLPPEVTRELSGLQDEVPPEDFGDIRTRIEGEFGRPLEEVFAQVDPEPVGAASLAQVHRAQLAEEPETPEGGEDPLDPVAGDPAEDVVVKVLRPGIEVLVQTDLAAIDLALRWMKWVRRIRERVDLDRLAAEFRRTTQLELDLEAEATHAERFAEMFADDPAVRVPRVYRRASTRGVLTLENVGFLKIADHGALKAAGIDRTEVARKLYGVYMRQIFEYSFVHADPHPGNLFVEPLPTADEEADGVHGFAPGETPHGLPPGAPARHFRLAFVDFGMVATIPRHLRGALREALIALGTRDSARMVRAYQSAGVLLPGADLQRLEEVHREVLDRFWGVPLGQLREVAMAEMRTMMHRYRDLIYEMPLQVQVDLLFTARAVGILSGLSTSLDPEFNPWAETLPHARRMAAEEARLGLQELLEEVARQARALLTLPSQLDSTLTQGRDGRLTVRTELTPESRSVLERLDRSGRRLAWIVAASGFLLAGVLTGPESWSGRILIVAAGLGYLIGWMRGR